MSKDWVKDVEEFHLAANNDIAAWPRLLSAERLNQRMMLIDEEFEELMEAAARDNITNVADGAADLIYVTIGLCLEMGIPLSKVWNEVHASNMRKFSDGIHTNGNGKIAKPLGWEPPDIRSIIVKASEY